MKQPLHLSSRALRVIIAAVITPTGDPFTLALVSVPIYLLWELSILIVKHTEQ